MSSLLCPLMLYTMKKEKRSTSTKFEAASVIVENNRRIFEQCRAITYPSHFRPTQKAVVIENFRPNLPDEVRLCKGDHVSILLRDGDWLFVRKEIDAIFAKTTSLDDIRPPSAGKLPEHEGFAPSRCFQLVIDCPTLGNLKIPAKYATLPSLTKSSTIDRREKLTKFKSLTLPRKWPKFQLSLKNKRNSQSAMTSPPLARRPASPEALANIHKFMESIGEDLLHHSVATKNQLDHPNRNPTEANQNENTFDEQQFEDLIHKTSSRDNSYDSGITLSEENDEEELQLDDFDIQRMEGKSAVQDPSPENGPHLVPLAASLLDSSFSSISLSDDQQQQQRDVLANRCSSGCSTESNNSNDWLSSSSTSSNQRGYELIVTEDVKPKFAGDLALRRFDLIFCCSKSFGNDQKGTIENAWIWAFCPRTNSYGFVRRDVTKIPIGTII